MSNTRVFAKGEILFKEGDRTTHLYIVQSGLVSLFLPRPKKNVDLFQVTTWQVLGEYALQGAATHPVSAVAMNETKVLEVPIEVIKAQLESSPQLFKLLLKSLGEKQRNTFNEIKSFKMERDSSPCPPDSTAKVFGTVFHTAKHTGKPAKDTGKITVTWPGYKQYAQRIFMEPPTRLEQAVNILVKLKLAELQMVKNDKDPEAPEELGYVHFTDLAPIERFFEFYQHYFFKGGSTEILKVDDKSMNLVAALLKVTEAEKVNRSGIVQMNFKTMTDKLKEILGDTFHPDSLQRLEQKGLFVKREANEQGGFLSLFRQDFEHMLLNWKILKEIDKWNEKGFVELNEAVAKKKTALTNCPGCKGEVNDKQKFCSNCGHNLTGQAAA